MMQLTKNTFITKITALTAAAVCTLAFAATAFAATFISSDEARTIAAKLVPSESTYLLTKEEAHHFAPYYEVKFYNNATNTEYEVEVLKSNGAVKEFKMDARAAMGSSNIVLSAAEIQNLVLQEFPNAVFHKVKLESDDGLYEYEVKFTTSTLRGEMKFNPATGVVLEKELKYQV